MSTTKKIIIVLSFMMLITHIVRYSFYDADILQASMGSIAMILLIISQIISKEEK